MKKIIWIIIILIVAAGVWYFTGYKKSTNEVDQNAVSGTITNINTDGVALDGPSLVTIKSNNGVESVIAVPSMGINLCAARASIADVYTLKVGDKVSVNGTKDESGRIVPCESSSHYLKTE